MGEAQDAKMVLSHNLHGFPLYIVTLSVTGPTPRHKSIPERSKNFLGATKVHTNFPAYFTDSAE